MGSRISILIGITTFFSVASGVWICQTLIFPESIGDTAWLTPLVAGIAAATLAALMSWWFIGRPLKEVARFLESQAHGGGLERLSRHHLGPLKRIGRAANALAASRTSLEVDVIDHKRELEVTQKELRLQDELEAKNEELSQRLRERALLFDILRISASGGELDDVLDELAQRLGRALELREFTILLREAKERTDDAEERLVVRSVYGFEEPTRLLGRSIRMGEGISGQVATHLSPIVIEDVSDAPDYLAFWDEVSRQGSFASLPILHRGSLIGLIALTRPAEHPIKNEERLLLEAISGQLALAIRHVELVDELKEMSTHDDLTGLGNRRLMRAQLEMEQTRAQRFDNPLSMLMLDVDYFKELNDRHGHPEGDAALKELADFMTLNLRQVDTIARVGGEEFAIVLPRADLEQAVRIAEQLRQDIAEHDFPGAEGQPGGRLTVSIGVTQYAPGEPIDELIRRADQALYQAKTSGRNRVASFEGIRSRKDSGFIAKGPESEPREQSAT